MEKYYALRTAAEKIRGLKPQFQAALFEGLKPHGNPKQSMDFSAASLVSGFISH